MNYRSRADTAPKKSAAVRNPPSYGYKPSWNKPRSLSPSQNIPPHHQVPVDSRASKGSIHNASQGPIIQRKQHPHQELLVMTIDLGDGTKDLLKVFEGDDPFHLARVFCERHQLNIQLVEPLAQNIYGNMEQVLQESVHTLNLVAPGHENDQLPEMQSIEGQDTGKFRGIAEAASHFGGSNYENQEEEEQQYGGRNYNDYAQIERYNPQINEHERRDMHMRGRDGERLSSQNQHPQTRGSTQSRKYDDEAEMYEMIDHDDNGELIAERVSPKNMGGAIRNGLTEKDLRMSKGRRDDYQESQKSKMASPQQYEQRGNQMHFGSAEQGRPQGNSDYQSEPKPGKSWTSGEEFQNEEEYLDYLVNSQYGVGKEKPPAGRYDLTFVPHINQQSKQMLENRGQNKGNVYERLHDESKIKNTQHSQQNVLRQSHSAQKTNSSTIKSQAGLDINYGTLLYHRGVKKGEDTKKQLIERRKEKIEKLSKECTFKPELNKISQQIMSTKARYENTEDKLIRSGKDAKDKLERARSAKKAKEVEECTFHPEINFISQRIDSEKSKMAHQLGHDRYSKLFNESRMRQDHQHVVSQIAPPECTFKPMINNYNGSAIGQTTFEQRDQKFRDRMERINYMRQLKEEAEVRDPETGEPLFRPKTGRSPIGRNSGNLPIGDYLYIQQYKIAENKRRLNENHERSVKANMARSSENSHIIVENLMRRRLEDIFRRFDSDGDGCISSAKIDITGVGNDVLETLAPILCEMEERNQILDFEAFCEQIDRLFRFLTVAEKDKLLLGKKESPQESLWTFQPEIDKRSERIAQRKHPYGDFHSLYGSYIDERKKLNQKIQDQQEKNSQDQLKECSFKPRLYTSPKSSSLLSSTKGYPRGPGNNYFMDDLLI